MQLTIAINLISSKDTDEERVTHSKIDNIEIIFSDKADKVTEKLFQSLHSICQIGLETSMKDSEFVFVILIEFIYCITNIKKQMYTKADIHKQKKNMGKGK